MVAAQVGQVGWNDIVGCRLRLKSLVHLYGMRAYAIIMQVLKLSDIYQVGSREGFRGIKYFYVIHFWSSYNSGLDIYFL